MPISISTPKPLERSYLVKTLRLPDWVDHVQWENLIWVVIVPILGLIAATSTPLVPKTAIFATIYHANTGLGITAGLSSQVRMVHHSY